MASLTGTKIKDTYDSLLKVSDNGALDGTLQTITDGVGNNSALRLSTAGASVGGTLAVSGAATLSSTLGVSGAATLSSTLAVTGTSVLTGNVGVGVTPAAWNANSKAIQLPQYVSLSQQNNASLNLMSFALETSGNTFTYADTGVYPLRYNQNPNDGAHTWYSAGTGTAGNTITFTEKMKIYNGGDISFRDSSANEAFYWDASAASLGIGTASLASGRRLTLNGSAQFRSDAGSGASFNVIPATNGEDGVELNLSYYTGSGYGPMKFITGGSERMRIDSSGNVGIGTNNPSGMPLAIQANSGNAAIRLIGTSASSSNNAGIYWYNSDNTTFNGYIGNFNTEFFIYNHRNTPMSFYTNGTERMRIDSSGNVGIGTTPAQVLDVRKATASGDTQFNFVNSSNSSSGNTSVTSTIYLGFNDDNNGLANANKIVSGKSGDYTSAPAANSFLAFHTTNANTTAERMRITSGGYFKASNNGTYVGSGNAWHEINASHPSDPTFIVSGNNGSYGGFGLQSRINRTSSGGNYAFFSAFDSAADVTRFIVHDDGDVENINNAYGAISDIKLKENIADASPKLDDLLKVKIRSYNLIENGFKQIGVIAQELEEVFPSMITEKADFKEVEVPQLDENGQEVLDENGEVVMTKERVDLGTVTKSVKYSVFVPMLIKAIQEQQEIINDLKSRIEQLEA